MAILLPPASLTLSHPPHKCGGGQGRVPQLEQSDKSEFERYRATLTAGEIFDTMIHTTIKGVERMENLFELQFAPRQVKDISNLGLAHIGDGVFELLCRSYLCVRGDKTVLKLHKNTVELVRAPTQAKFAEKLLPLLTEEETDYFRRGKNAHTHSHPKGATAREYALATGLEALFGALYLMGRRERLNVLFLSVMEELYGV